MQGEGGMTWTKEMEDQLREDWPTLLSTAVIARRLGKTKNAVIGKAGRMKLGKKTESIHCGRALPITRTKASIGAQNGLNMKGRKPYKLKKVAYRKKVAKTVYGEGKSLMEVKEGECRWPVGDKPFTYCAAKIERGSYCKHHAEVGYQ